MAGEGRVELWSSLPRRGGARVEAPSESARQIADLRHSPIIGVHNDVFIHVSTLAKRIENKRVRACHKSTRRKQVNYATASWASKLSGSVVECSADSRMSCALASERGKMDTLKGLGKLRLYWSAASHISDKHCYGSRYSSRHALDLWLDDSSRRVFRFGDVQRGEDCSHREEHMHMRDVHARACPKCRRGSRSVYTKRIDRTKHVPATEAEGNIQSIRSVLLQKAFGNKLIGIGVDTLVVENGPGIAFSRKSAFAYRAELTRCWR